MNIPKKRQKWRDHPWSSRSLWRRQVSVAICLGLNAKQIAEALGIGEAAAAQRIYVVLMEHGMADRYEFATQMNAAVRETLRGE